MNDLDRVIKFVANWAGLPLPLPSSTRLPKNTPLPLQRLASQLGAFWDEPPFPFADETRDHNIQQGLFGVQDKILDPRQQTPDALGLSILAYENQGVWSFTYDSDNQVYFSGDWIWGDFPSSKTPTPFPASIDDVLCFTLLLNALLFVEGEDWQDIFDARDKWADDINRKVWDHPAWNRYKGVWTNEAGDALLIEGIGFQRLPSLSKLDLAK